MQLNLTTPRTSAVAFAGMGGACEGIAKTLGRSPLVAINHDDHSIRLHKMNHPHTVHYREDVYRVDPALACNGRRLRLFWLSPDCTDHSNAKGSAPRSAGRRSLADVIFMWLKDADPDYCMLENVPEWLDWGPLIDGRRDNTRKGEYFREWLDQVQSYGRRVEWRVLRASDYGVPTSRTRVYLVAAREGLPIIWPEPTHGPGKLPYATAAQCIDWSLPMASITNRRTPLSGKTMTRIEHGRALYGDKPFLVEYYGTGLSADINAPLHTITCVDRFGLVHGDGFRMLQPRELARAMGFPDSYILEGTKREQVARIGNAVCPPMAALLARMAL